MNDTFLVLLSEYGLLALFFTTMLSCLAIPIPASIVMVTAGAYAIIGDWSFLGAVSAALAGAVVGDQLGYFIGRFGARHLLPKGVGFGHRARLLSKARMLTYRYGAKGIFLSRWLFSPLGPYVNFMAGGAHFAWLRFSAWSVLGEICWVCIYVGLGFTFAQQLNLVLDLVIAASGALLWLAVTLLLGGFLIWRVRRLMALRRAHHQSTDAIAYAGKQVKGMFRRH